MNNFYVQYGCGWSAPKEWRNFDASPTLRFEKLPIIGALYTRNERRFPDNVEYGDIVKGLRISRKSCKVVYCSHVLEHLSLGDFRVALKNTHEILQDGSTFRFVLPDLDFHVREYVDNKSHDAALSFMMETGLGQENNSRNFLGKILSSYGNSRHLWMWDYKSIEAELLNAGFHEVRRAVFGDSTDSMFLMVEDRTRWNSALGVECKK